MAAGRSKANPIPKKKARNFSGSAPDAGRPHQSLGRISLRMGPKDFKCRTSYGSGDDWPITYDEIKPYYDRVDRLIGVYGSMEGMENDPDGIFLPPPKPRLNELFVKKAATGLGIKVIAGRGAVMTAPLPGNNDRQACFFCGQCNRSCKIYGDFSSSSCLVIPAIKTGNLEVRPNAFVREILTDSSGLATGVSYINKDDMQEYQVKAKVVILAASTCESARILLNSKSSAHPNGLANTAMQSANTCTIRRKAAAPSSFRN
jgi:choline dehydrogenase-like flavoprotein